MSNLAALATSVSSHKLRMTKPAAECTCNKRWTPVQSFRAAAADVVQIPVLVSDLDLECQLWLKIRLAPMTPYFGTIALAFVGPPTIKVQLLPYNRVRLMRVPVVQVCYSALA